MAMHQGVPFMGGEPFVMEQPFPMQKDNLMNMMQMNHQYNLMMMQQNFFNPFPKPFPNLLYGQNINWNSQRDHIQYDQKQMQPLQDYRNKNLSPKIHSQLHFETKKQSKEVIVIIDSDDEQTDKKILQLNHQKQETSDSDSKIKYLHVQKTKISKKIHIQCKNCNRRIIQKKNLLICQKCESLCELKQYCLIQSKQQEKKEKMIQMRHLRLQKRFSKLKKINHHRNIQTQKWENQLKLLNNYKIQVGQMHQVAIPNLIKDIDQDKLIKTRIQLIKQNLLSPDVILECQKTSCKDKKYCSQGSSSQESSNNSVNTQVAFQQSQQSNQKKFSQRILQKKYSLQKV